MSSTTLTCDQAIFTSIRTPMGEGYRIVAASPGLRADEKQSITRNSPSHEGMCAPAPTGADADRLLVGAAFYVLPSGRLCVALSCLAGAEHTGRGGHRVYTHNVVFHEAEFCACGYNAFNVLRAMVAADAASPQLKPPAVLPELELSVQGTAGPQQQAALHPALASPVRCRVLQRLLEHRRLIVNIEDGWLESAETLLLGLPGPLRSKVSFGAGLKFSVGRCHDLHLLFDATNFTKTRIVGQPVEYIDPHSASEPFIAESAWVRFVDRLWECGDNSTLAARTSRPFPDVTPAGFERVGRLFNNIDEIHKTTVDELLVRVRGSLRPATPSNEVESMIAEDFAAKAQSHLRGQFRTTPWPEQRRYWPTLVETWKSSARGVAFVQPLLQEALRAAAREDPINAAEVAVEVARDLPPGIDSQAHRDMLDEVLNALAARLRTDHDLDPVRLQHVCDLWQPLRPDSPTLEQIRERCPAAAGR